MKDTHRAKNVFTGLAVILAVVIFGLANCSNPAGGGGGGVGGIFGGGGGSLGGTEELEEDPWLEPVIGNTNITSVNISITAPVKGATPPTTASGSDEVENFTIGAVSWSPANNPFLGNIVYTASVTLTANSNYTFTGLSSATINGQSGEVSNNTGSAVTLSHTFSATDTKTVTSITIKTQPTKLTYTHGDTFDLTGLVLTLTHDDSTTEDVDADLLWVKNVTANPGSYSRVSYSTHNGQPVKITYGNLTCNTSNLTVNKATPIAADFDISGLTQTYNGNPKTVTITPKEGKSDGTITVKYNDSTTAPSAAGTYTVTFDVATGTNYNAASEFSCGSLEIKTASFTTAPTTLTLTAGDGKFTYTWTDSEPPADSYDVYWKVGSGMATSNVKTGTKITGAVSGGEITGLTNGTTYSVVVTANKANYTSNDSSVKTVRPSLPSFTTAPTLTLTAGNAKLTYTWTDSTPPADSYDIYWKAGIGLTAANIKTGTKITGAVSGGEITGLTNDTTYSVVVTANKAGYNSVDSKELMGHPALAFFFTIAPKLTFTRGDGKLTYTLTDSTPPADSYDIYWIKEEWSDMSVVIKDGTKITGAISNGEITGLTNGTAYSVVVTANKADCKSINEGIYHLTTLFVFTTAPALTLTAGDAKITYTWTDSEPPADSYDVYWKAGSGLTAADIKTGTKITGAVSGRSISGLTNGTAYSVVVVTAIKTDYKSIDSAVQTATPVRAFTTAPTLTLTAGNAKLTYTWTASNPAADSYDVYWKAGNGLTAADVKTGTKITGATSGGEITGLTNGTAYSVVVTANKANYTSIDSTVRTVTPSLASFITAPTLTLTAGNAKFTYTSTASSPAPDSYDVYWKAGNGLTAADVKTGTKITGATNGGSISELTNGTAYSVVVTANKANYTSIDSTVRTVTPSLASFTTTPTLTLTAGNAKLTYTWTASSPAADSYDVYWKAGNGLTAADVKTGTKITGATSGGEITGLTNGTAYSVVVTANKAGYNAADSTVRTGTLVLPVNAVQPVISAQPQSGSFFKTGTLSVTASVTDGGALTYQWYRNTSNSATGGTAIVGATGSSYTLSNLGTYYYYVIITNTIVNNGDGGTKTAQITSNVVAVTFELVQAEWARTVDNVVYGFSEFNAVAKDSSGNVYAVGYQTNTGTYTYGTGVSANGASVDDNVVLVKYNSGGTALWARTVSAGNKSRFNAVAVDASGNVYAAGYQMGTNPYTYGTGVSAKGASVDNNVVLVKYNSSGAAQWARTVSAGNDGSEFKAVAVDASGNVYAAGYQMGTDTYTYGTGVSASSQGFTISSTNSSANVVLVKYDSSGTAQWARTVVNELSSNVSEFNAVAVDSSGNVYAAGYQRGSYFFTYGAVVVSAHGYHSNVVLVKYDSGGTAQWARTVSEGSTSEFKAVAVDASGNVYAAGYQYGNDTYTYGTGVSAQGSRDNYHSNVVLVKYDSGGTAQWARTVSNGGSTNGGYISEFNAVAVDASGNVYAAGYQYGSDTYTYGTEVSAQGSGYQQYKVVLVKYDSGGTAQWARTVTGVYNYIGSKFNAVAVDASGNVYAAGYQYGTDTYTYGTEVSARGNGDNNSGEKAVLVKYKN